MFPAFNNRRQVDKYDGQNVYIGNKVVYELGNYLGGGASGSVYQAFDVSTSSSSEKSVAIKILNPLGYKLLPLDQFKNKCVVLTKGAHLTQEQALGKAPFSAANVWWLLMPSTKQVIAAYEDPIRNQLRELTLPKCVEIWGWSPLVETNTNLIHTDNAASNALCFLDNAEIASIEKRNVSDLTVRYGQISVPIPHVAPKYLKWLINRQAVCREMLNMMCVGAHPNIIGLMEVLELLQDSKATLFLVLEFVHGGELFDRMKSGAGGASEEFCRRYFVQLLSGLEFCHVRGIVHRDLKPENLLLSDPNDNATLKIADFGLSAVVHACEEEFGQTRHQPTPEQQGSHPHTPQKVARVPSTQTMQAMLGPLLPLANNAGALPLQHHEGAFSTPLPMRRLRSIVGSPHYIAPEIIHSESSGYDGKKVDMWSAGIILYTMLLGKHPFGGDLATCKTYMAYKRWMNSEGAATSNSTSSSPIPSVAGAPEWLFPSSISRSAVSLLLWLLHVDPLQRCTAAEALHHPWCLGSPVPSSSNVSGSISNNRAASEEYTTAALDLSPLKSAITEAPSLPHTTTPSSSGSSPSCQPPPAAVRVSPTAAAASGSLNSGIPRTHSPIAAGSVVGRPHSPPSSPADSPPFQQRESGVLSSGFTPGLNTRANRLRNSGSSSSISNSSSSAFPVPSVSGPSEAERAATQAQIQAKEAEAMRMTGYQLRSAASSASASAEDSPSASSSLGNVDLFGPSRNHTDSTSSSSSRSSHDKNC